MERAANQISEDLIMSGYVNQAGMPKNLSASANVCPRSCALIGIWVSSASNTPTIAVYNSATTGTTAIVANTFTPAPGFYPMPFNLTAGCYVVISGTVDCTVSVVAS